LPKLVPFPTFRGKQVLEIGCGAGYDAFEFMRNGADYTGIDLVPENPNRVRKHLGYFGFEPRVLEADAESLPFEDETFDVVFSNGVLMSTPDMDRAFREANRVLRRGGEFYLTVYNRDSVFYWLSVVLFDHVLRGGFLNRSLAERRSLIEYTTSKERPLVDVYSRRQVVEKLEEAGFHPVATRVRKLVAEDLPGIPLVGRLWPYVPQRWFDELAKRWGWYVVARARRPSRPA
jgi:ubiquinone/menaquinone biosynthesis C-methylase UbiE